MPTGTVKWFNTAKGFGFIAPEDGGGDVFVHVSALERAGLRDLAEGQAIQYELEADRRSGKMSAGSLQLVGPARPAPSRGFGESGDRNRASPRPAPRSEATLVGTVKFFNAAKGFGFIEPESGGSDVFVHISAVERSGLRTLVDGQRVAYALERDRKTGKDAATNLQALS